MDKLEFVYPGKLLGTTSDYILGENVYERVR